MVRISDKDHGFKALRVAVRSARGAVAVGVTDAPHEPTGIPTDVLGAIHELGLGTAPQRSFLRGWVDENQTGVRQSLAYWVTASLTKGVVWRTAMNAFGAYCVKGIRTRMRAGIEPELLPETARRKGHDTPLIDTEQLIDGIIYELHEKV